MVLILKVLSGSADHASQDCLSPLRSIISLLQLWTILPWRSLPVLPFVIWDEAKPLAHLPPPPDPHIRHHTGYPTLEAEGVPKNNGVCMYPGKEGRKNYGMVGKMQNWNADRWIQIPAPPLPRWFKASHITFLSLTLLTVKTWISPCGML